MRLLGRDLLVSDLARSSHFYCNAFGFSPIPITHHLHALLPRAACDAERLLLVNPHGAVLRLQTASGGSQPGPGLPRPMNRIGPTHLNFYVRDLPGTLADIERAGGYIRTETLTEAPEAGVTMIYCADPDAIRVEVWTTLPYNMGGMAKARAGTERSLSHSGLCVSDPERSMAYYAELGFLPAEMFDYRDPPGVLDAMNGTSGSRLVAQMLRSGDDILELLVFEEPRPVRTIETSQRPRFHGLIFAVESLELTSARLAAIGGPWIISADGESCRCADFDGTPITLVRNRA